MLRFLTRSVQLFWSPTEGTHNTSMDIATYRLNRSRTRGSFSEKHHSVVWVVQWSGSDLFSSSLCKLSKNTVLLRKVNRSPLLSPQVKVYTTQCTQFTVNTIQCIQFTVHTTQCIQFTVHTTSFIKITSKNKNKNKSNIGDQLTCRHCYWQFSCTSWCHVGNRQNRGQRWGRGCRRPGRARTTGGQLEWASY